MPDDAGADFKNIFPMEINFLNNRICQITYPIPYTCLLSFIVEIGKGFFLPDIFEISDLLLTDKDDLVRKGYGWMLKEASKSHLQEVFDYVMKNKKEMPRTSLRYAIEKFPPDLRAEAMKK